MEGCALPAIQFVRPIDEIFLGKSSGRSRESCHGRKSFIWIFYAPISRGGLNSVLFHVQKAKAFTKKRLDTLGRVSQG